MGLPIINVAKTNDKRGVGKLPQTLIVSFDKKCIAPNGPIDIPKIPDITAIGNPNLSSCTAILNFLPKIKKKNIINKPKKLINREFEKISLLCREKIFTDFKIYSYKSKLINKIFQIKKAPKKEPFDISK